MNFFSHKMYWVEINKKSKLIHTCGSTYDVQIDGPLYIKGGEVKFINTGIKLNMPTNVYAELKSRSGLFKNYQLFIFNGIIDNDYHGEIGIMVKNMNSTDVFLDDKTIRICQIIFKKSIDVTLMENKKIPENNHIGFGSTGIL